jgi:hypothetical protein
MVTAKVKLQLLVSEVNAVKPSATLIQSCSWTNCFKHIFLKILFVYVCGFRFCSTATICDELVSPGSLL